MSAVRGGWTMTAMVGAQTTINNKLKVAGAMAMMTARTTTITMKAAALAEVALRQCGGGGSFAAAR
jgi:hypothetical protein